MVDGGIDPLGAGSNPVGEVSWSRMAKDSGHQSGAQREGPPRPTVACPPRLNQPRILPGRAAEGGDLVCLGIADAPQLGDALVDRAKSAGLLHLRIRYQLRRFHQLDPMVGQIGHLLIALKLAVRTQLFDRRGIPIVSPDQRVTVLGRL
jgi:hypothetical protein